MAELTLTMRVKLSLPEQDKTRLTALCSAYASCCNDVSAWIGDRHTLSQKAINKAVYHPMRDRYGLLAQITQSAIRRVIASYKTIHTRLDHDKASRKRRHGKARHYFDIRPVYRASGIDLLWNRDYSYSHRTGMFSLPVMDGRIKAKAVWKGIPDTVREGRFGTARLECRDGSWFLLTPSTIPVPDPSPTPSTIVGVDLGIRMLTTSYDGDNTVFQRGGEVKTIRGRYKTLRARLQKRGTRSARKHLKAIGRRENRWMTDINHQVSKALVDRYGPDTMFVLENLSGIRNATERVRVKDRYTQVSWAFSQLRRMIEYKAQRNGQTVVAVDPRYTSQTCPKCGLVLKQNRDKRLHLYACRNCGYRSNDDRVAAMNLRHKGYDLLMAQYAAGMPDGVGVQSTTP